MNGEQILLFAILGAVFALLIWGRAIIDFRSRRTDPPGAA